MTKAIQEKPTLNQRESLINHHLKNQPSIAEVFDLDDAWERLEGISIGTYRYMLSLSFQGKKAEAEMKRMLEKLGFKLKIIN